MVRHPFLCYCVMVLPHFGPDGELPAGVHFASREDFRARFGVLTSRRL
jgi:hypothetical protein